jgi:predicted transposase YbfD/YdcC
MPVKENQPRLLGDLELLFADPELVAATGTRAETRDVGHGRIERRELWTSTALVGYTDWPGLAQALCIERTRIEKRSGRQERERNYAVTSLPPDRATAAQFLPLWREHWGIENKVHWVRDVTFDEDRSQGRTGNVPQVMAALRNTVIGCLHAHGITTVAAARRHFASHVAEAITLLGL